VKQIVLDFETYYDAEYSLRKMTPVQYILDPRFEVIGCAVKEGEGTPFWLTHTELVAYLKKLPERVTIISHNALFDMCILAWVYGYTPTLMIDTMGMARAWMGHKLRSVALASIATYLGIGAKGDTVHKVMGMNLAAIKAAGLYDAYAAYSCTDAELCWKIYRHFINEGFPVNEIAIMDTVIRCAVRPKFVLDETLLAEHLHNTVQSKHDLMARCGLSGREDLMSNDRFADSLRAFGVEPPTKISLTTGKETYAFAKTDQEFMDLEEHENPDVQALVSARLGVKSTIEETRTQRLIEISRLTWPGNGVQGLLPMPLRYSGAHTHRLSGDWKLNMQNLPARGNTKIRQAIQARPGFKVVGCDASQIEARIAAWFCGAGEIVTAFARKEDVYSTFASSVFGYEVLKATHPVERFIGKTAILGLQYNLGWPKFQKTVAMQSKAQVGKEVILSDEEAARVVNTYRSRYFQIPAMWKKLQALLPLMTGNLHAEVGPVTFIGNSIRLPSGLFLNYHALQNKEGSWWFTYGGKPKYVYGGKMLENIIQALARICVMDAAVRVRIRLQQLGIEDVELNLQVHDELVYVVPDGLVETVKAIVMEEMCRRPSWGPHIPLDAEADVGQAFG
jgi:DNA polymerase family A